MRVGGRSLTPGWYGAGHGSRVRVLMPRDRAWSDRADGPSRARPATIVTRGRTSPGSRGAPRTPPLMHATRLSLLASTLAVVIGVVAFAGVAPVSRAGTAPTVSETPSASRLPRRRPRRAVDRLHPRRRLHRRRASPTARPLRRPAPTGTHARANLASPAPTASTHATARRAEVGHAAPAAPGRHPRLDLAQVGRRDPDRTRVRPEHDVPAHDDRVQPARPAGEDHPGPRGPRRGTAIRRTRSRSTAHRSRPPSRQMAGTSTSRSTRCTAPGSTIPAGTRAG